MIHETNGPVPYHWGTGPLLLPHRMKFRSQHDDPVLREPAVSIAGCKASRPETRFSLFPFYLYFMLRPGCRPDLRRG